ncbi:MAG: O-antigen ligase family protein [Bacteroidales bacterium]|nr:O-antigen ligase family protein [Bacteroidales bacterium]
MWRKPQMSFTRKSVHQNIFFLLLATLVVAMPTSKFLMSAMMIFLGANWLLEACFREKWNLAKGNEVLHAFLALYLVHVVWCLFSSNLDYALDDLRKKLPLLVLPIVVLTSTFLDRKKIANLLQIFCLAVAVASVVGIVRYLGNPDMEYRNIFPHFSHIRFSINVCMAIVLLMYAIHKVLKRKDIKLKWLRIVGILMLEALYCVILLLLQSYTAFVILAVTFVVLLGWLAVRKKSQPRYAVVFFAVIAVAVVGVWLCFSHYRSNYYTLQELSLKPLETTTANGNAYTHANDGLIEMGNYINNYVCREELASQWAKRSAINIDSLTPNSFAVYPTLVRYLNAKGLTKDSAGVAQLQQYDIELIEQGVANHYYARKFDVGKMLYRMFFEYDSYCRDGNVRNSSLLQRFELWRNGLAVFVAHPVIGVGTGDVADEVGKSLEERNSQLAGLGMRTHNQYITLLLTFGVVGVAIITTFFFRAIRRQKLLKSALFVACMCIVLVSFVSEDTLETEAGVVFSTLMPLLLSHWATESPKQ